MNKHELHGSFIESYSAAIKHPQLHMPPFIKDPQMTGLGIFSLKLGLDKARLLSASHPSFTFPAYAQIPQQLRKTMRSKMNFWIDLSVFVNVVSNG
ncbi:hypothetical protein OHJ21_21665 [Virgibacillus sp. LDC1]|uniref:hypothetical protein n=1 Tax=Paenibacillus sp. GM2FR TaxID=2059268 RepID=UPI0010548431|nr:hypothetical protein [Paenibacillus sp. GM2FR]MCV4233772.1 hypothetical protein [Virgibacillus sp. LDC1]